MNQNLKKILKFWIKMVFGKMNWFKKEHPRVTVVISNVNYADHETKLISNSITLNMPAITNDLIG